jgi:hypothetical protein
MHINDMSNLRFQLLFTLCSMPAESIVKFRSAHIFLDFGIMFEPSNDFINVKLCDETELTAIDVCGPLFCKTVSSRNGNSR